MIYILDAETGEDYEEKNTTWHMKKYLNEYEHFYCMFRGKNAFDLVFWSWHYTNSVHGKSLINALFIKLFLLLLLRNASHNIKV